MIGFFFKIGLSGTELVYKYGLIIYHLMYRMAEVATRPDFFVGQSYDPSVFVSPMSRGFMFFMGSTSAFSFFIFGTTNLQTEELTKGGVN